MGGWTNYLFATRVCWLCWGPQNIYMLCCIAIFSGDIFGSLHFSMTAGRKGHWAKHSKVRYSPLRFGAKPRVWQFPGDILGALEEQCQRWLSAILRPSYMHCIDSSWSRCWIRELHTCGGKSSIKRKRDRKSSSSGQTSMTSSGRYW